MNLQALSKGDICPDSYWVGASREELVAKSAARKHQQALPTDVELAKAFGVPLKRYTAQLGPRSGQ